MEYQIVITGILLLVFFVAFIMSRREGRRKLQEIQQQLEECRKSEEALREREQALSQLREAVMEKGNIIHLYASLTEEEAQLRSLKNKQAEIRRAAEALLELAEQEDFT